MVKILAIFGLLAPVAATCVASSPLLIEAESRVAANDWPSADRLLGQLLQSEPDNVEALFQRGFVRFRLRDFDHAKEDLLKVVTLAPPALRSRELLGRIASLEGRPLDAIDWLRPALDAEPVIPEVASELAKAYFETDQLELALASARRALTLAPWDGGLHYRMGRIFQQLGDADKARAEFEESIRLKSQDADAVGKLMKCSSLARSGALGEALAIRDDLISQPNLDPDVLVSLGLTLADAGMLHEAADAFHDAARRDSSLFQASYNEGLALLKAGSAEAAERPLLASVTLLPGSRDANSALGLDYVLRGEYRRAIPFLEAAHAEDTRNSRTSSLLALCYLRSGAPVKSVAILRQIVPTESVDPKPAFLLIEALNATNDPHAALVVAAETAKRFPANPKARLAEAQQMARLGKYLDAAPVFQKAVELLPEDVEARLGLGEVQNKSGDYQSSLTTYRAVLAVDRCNDSATAGAAQNLLSLGRAPDAQEILETCLPAHSDSRRLRFELSRVYARLGDKDRAAEQVRLMNESRDASQ